MVYDNLMAHIGRRAIRPLSGRLPQRIDELHRPGQGFDMALVHGQGAGAALAGQGADGLLVGLFASDGDSQIGGKELKDQARKLLGTARNSP